MGGYVGFRDFYVQAGSAYLAPEESVALDLEAQAEQTVEVLQFGNRHLAACIIQ